MQPKEDPENGTIENGSVITEFSILHEFFDREILENRNHNFFIKSLYWMVLLKQVYQLHITISVEKFFLAESSCSAIVMAITKFQISSYHIVLWFLCFWRIKLIIHYVNWKYFSHTCDIVNFLPKNQSSFYNL